MKIQIENLSKKYKKKDVLNSINCTLEPKKYGIIGPNGSGKTTLIRCLLQIIDYKGNILFDGQKISNNICIGYLPQSFGGV